MNCRRARREETYACVREAGTRTSGRQHTFMVISLLDRPFCMVTSLGCCCAMVGSVARCRACCVSLPRRELERCQAHAAKLSAFWGRRTPGKGTPAAASAAKEQQDDERVECTPQTVNRRADEVPTWLGPSRSVPLHVCTQRVSYYTRHPPLRPHHQLTTLRRGG